MKYAALVLKNLLRSKRRTILTVLSIAVSLFIFSALVSVPTVVQQILSDTASSTRIATHNKAGLAYSIPSRLQAADRDNSARRGGAGGELVRRRVP